MCGCLVLSLVSTHQDWIFCLATFETLENKGGRFGTKNQYDLDTSSIKTFGMVLRMLAEDALLFVIVIVFVYTEPSLFSACETH